MLRQQINKAELLLIKVVQQSTKKKYKQLRVKQANEARICYIGVFKTGPYLSFNLHKKEKRKLSALIVEHFHNK